MESNILELSGVMKDYGKGHGIFDIHLAVREGEVYGYAGTNGSGKTTTIRHLMGFIRPDAGAVRVKGSDAWKKASELKNYVSYIPGEIEFPKFRSGTEFLKYQAQFYGLKNYDYMNRLISRLELDPGAGLSRMSKGMKQKTAIVAALMADKEILLLDEPTTGLDPLMREIFLEILHEEKKKGKTIFMSSHSFEEIEDVCDRASIIHGGRLIDTIDLKAMKQESLKQITVFFSSSAEAASFAEQWGRLPDRKQPDEKVPGEDSPEACTIAITACEADRLFRLLADYSVTDLREEHMTMEKRFRQKLKEAAE